METSKQNHQIFVLILARFLLIIACGITLLMQKIRFPDIVALLETLEGFFLLVMFIINILYLILSHYIHRYSKQFIIFQITLDIIAETILIYLTGGTLSLFITLYFATIFSAALLINPNISYLYASFASIGISLVTALYFMASIGQIYLPFIPRQLYDAISEKNVSFYKAYLFAQCAGFYLVAFFISRYSRYNITQHSLHQEILENLSDAVIVLDKKQLLIYINKAAQNLLQISPRPNQPLLNQLHPDDHKEIIRTISMKQPQHYKTEIQQENGIIPIEIQLTPFFTKKKLEYHILIIQDISDQKRIQEEMLKTKQFQTISEIAAMIAHEIRNPLACIRGASQELQTFYTSQDMQYSLLDITIKESDRIEKIIKEFLNFSRHKQPSIRILNISEHLKEFTFYLQKRSDMQQTNIQQEIEPDLYAQADPEQLRQVLYNVAINAIESTKEMLQLSISAHQCTLETHMPDTRKFTIQERLKKYVHIQIQDNGNGFYVDNKEKLFSPFYTTKQQGTAWGWH